MSDGSYSASRSIGLRRACAAAALGVALVAAGCGGSDDGEDGAASDEAAITQVAEDFAAAANAADWEQVCTLFTPDAIAQAESLGVTCEQSFAERNPGEEISDVSVEDVEVNGEAATAVLRATNSSEGETESVQGFEKIDGEWKMGPADAAAQSP
jgi:ketosteroid isomerase-like protein